jgi:hypothetical protein
MKERAMPTARITAYGSIALCVGAYVLAVGSAVQNYLWWIGRTGGDYDWPGFLPQFGVIAVPIALAGLLAWWRKPVAASIVAVFGTLFYLLFWWTLGQ